MTSVSQFVPTVIAVSTKVCNPTPGSMPLHIPCAQRGDDGVAVTKSGRREGRRKKKKKIITCRTTTASDETMEERFPMLNPLELVGHC
ncbi:hypothetical protein GW17_00039776 [Ensete ventricosum]|nr:hypothetical protein GW17_00039776 [Ensete ventricosum]